MDGAAADTSAAGVSPVVSANGNAGVRAAAEPDAGAPVRTASGPPPGAEAGAEAGAAAKPKEPMAGRSVASAAGASGHAAASSAHAESGSGGMVVAGAVAAPSRTTCPLPSKLKWTASGVLAEPKSGWVALKDFTNVVHEGQHIVYMTTHDSGSKWGSAMFSFSEWQDASTATQVGMATSTVAPTLLYFEPKKTWVLAYQWGGPSFSYATATDPTDPSKWKFGQTLYSGKVAGSSTGPIDQSLICDSARCFLFFAADNGSIYRSSMAIDEFPSTFGDAQVILRESSNALFEAVEVYAVKGAGTYLMIVEAIGGKGRFFRAFTAGALDGEFTAMPEASSEATPFAGINNIVFDGAAWTNDISHGDLVRSSDQTKTVDPCNLQLLFQGRSPSSSGDYGKLPYRPGLLTLER